MKGGTIRPRRFGIGMIVLLALSGCASSPPDRSALDAVAWMQHSEEYRALSLGAYTVARANLDRALADAAWTALPSQRPADDAGARALGALPPAVILDIDDTVLSTLSYQAWLVKEGRPFSLESWNAWVSRADATALPGAREFVRHARQQGVTVFYLTNRARRGTFDRNDDGRIDPDEEQLDLKPYTLANLLREGLLPQPRVSNEDAVLLRGDSGPDGRVKPGWDSGDKSARRESLARRYRILLLMGDNINDFVDYRGQLADAPVADRYRERWGRSWIMMPNPVYGSWEQRLYGFRHGLPDAEQIRLKLDSLQPWQGP